MSHEQGSQLSVLQSVSQTSQVPMIAPLGCSLMEQSWGLVTFVTLITLLTIENLD